MLQVKAVRLSELAFTPMVPAKVPCARNVNARQLQHLGRSVGSASDLQRHGVATAEAQACCNGILVTVMTASFLHRNASQNKIHTNNPLRLLVNDHCV